jgi:hypothetical protein
MKSTCFSVALAVFNTVLASMGNVTKAEAPQGLRKLPGAQGVVVNGQDVATNPELKPIPGTAVEVTSLQPLLSLPSSTAGNTGVAATLTSLEGSAIVTSTPEIGLVTSSVSLGSIRRKSRY